MTQPTSSVVGSPFSMVAERDDEVDEVVVEAKELEMGLHPAKAKVDEGSSKAAKRSLLCIMATMMVNCVCLEPGPARRRTLPCVGFVVVTRLFVLFLCV